MALDDDCGPAADAPRASKVPSEDADRRVRRAFDRARKATSEDVPSLRPESEERSEERAEPG